MKTFDIQDLQSMDKFDYKFIVYSTSFESPLTHLDEITEELKQCNYSQCKVLFDLLLSIGNTSERFVEAIFDGIALEASSFKYIQIDKKNILRKQSCNYFKKHSNMLENSVLNSSQKKLLVKGISI